MEIANIQNQLEASGFTWRDIEFITFLHLHKQRAVSLSAFSISLFQSTQLLFVQEQKHQETWQSHIRRVEHLPYPNSHFYIPVLGNISLYKFVLIHKGVYCKIFQIRSEIQASYFCLQFKTILQLLKLILTHTKSNIQQNSFTLHWDICRDI